MLGEILGQMAQAVPGYVEGRQQAIKDNWQDLSNYNQVRAGQMNNALFQATMPYRWQDVVNNTQKNYYSILAAGRANALNFADTAAAMAIRTAQAPYVAPTAEQQASNAEEAARNVPFQRAMQMQLQALRIAHPEYYGSSSYSPWDMYNAFPGIGYNYGSPSVYGPSNFSY